MHFASKSLPDRPEVAGRFGIWSSDFSLVNGQAIVTARAAGLLSKVATDLFIYRGPGFRMLWTWLGAGLRLLWRSWFGRLDTLYMVCSRSNIGFMRDLPAYVSGATGPRMVIHVHGSDIVDMFRRPVIGPLARALVRQSELIVPSQHLVQPLHDIGIARVHVCENFVGEAPNDRPVPPSPELPQAAPGLRVLWNSNVLASKGFFELADAVASMHGRGLAVRLVALGSPLADAEMSLAQCRSRLTALGQHDWFDYRGPVDRSASTALLDWAEVVCLPSRYSSECQPLALIEAMCAGRRLVVSGSPALRATVGDYPCTFVASVSAQSIAAALEEEMRSPAATTPMGLAAQRARERFSARRFDEQMSVILGIPWSPSTARATEAIAAPSDATQ